MKCFYFIAFIVHSLLHSLAWGNSLALKDVLESVNQTYPTLLGAQQDIEKSHAENQSAKGGFDPVLKSTIQNASLGYYKNSYYDIALEQPTPLLGSKIITGYRSGTGTFPIYDARYQTFDQGEWRVGLDLPLLKNRSADERRTRITTTETGIEIARENFNSKKLEISREAGKKYWDWVAYGKKLKIAQEMLKIAQHRDHALATRVKKGDAAQIEYTDNQRSIAQRQAGVLVAHRSFQKASIELSLYFRDEKGIPIIASQEQVPHSFPDHTTESTEIPQLQEENSKRLNQLAENNPEIQSLNLQIQQIGYEKNLARNQILPKLDLSLALAKDLGVSPGTPYLPPSNYPYEFKVYLAFEMPLFLRTSRGKLSSITASENKLNLTQNLARDRIQSQILDSSQSMTLAAARIQYTKQEVELSKQLESAEQTRLDHGDSSILILNLREQATRDAMNKEIEALSDFFKAKIDYETFSAQM